MLSKAGPVSLGAVGKAACVQFIRIRARVDWNWAGPVVAGVGAMACVYLLVQPMGFACVIRIYAFLRFV